MKLALGETKKAPIKVPYTEPNITAILTGQISHLLENVPSDRELVVVCIGTDRSTGDALGPLVGSALKKHNSPLFNLYGTLEEPVHAMNLDETLLDINKHRSNPFIIGIDACLGQAASVGCIQAGHGPVRPGAGVKKDLPPIGDIHITGIVNVGGFMEYFVLQNTRLYLVMRMADIIAQCLFTSISKVSGRSLEYANAGH